MRLEKYIDIDTKGLSKGVAKAINTMKKHKEYMLNAVKYKYSNGPLEGFNNKIKLLKRVSYGYSSFSNFRLRILIISRLFVSEYKNNIKLKKIRKNLSSKMLPRFHFLFSPCPEFDKEPFKMNNDHP